MGACVGATAINGTAPMIHGTLPKGTRF